jgi:hypothetical protein
MHVEWESGVRVRVFKGGEVVGLLRSLVWVGRECVVWREPGRVKETMVETKSTKETFLHIYWISKLIALAYMIVVSEIARDDVQQWSLQTR